MPFSINEFKTALGERGGPMRANRFTVAFGIPPAVASTMQNSTLMSRDAEFWCDGINLPGYQLATMGVRRWTYGPEEKRPIAPVFTPLEASFLADSEGSFFKFFNSWMNITMPHDWYNGGINETSGFGGRQYELEYKANYATDLIIKAYDIAGGVTHVWAVKEAFPSKVSDISLNWNDGQNARFSVTFDYLDWTILSNASQT